MKKLISIVAPMYNEESLVSAYVAETFSALRTIQDIYDIEIVLVNDGSSDITYTKMMEEQKKHPKNLSVVCLSRNFGLEGAVAAGIRTARGDAVVVMDADLQDPPGIIPMMVHHWENGADIVIAKREKRPYDGFFKRMSADAFYRILDFFSGKMKLEEGAANYRLLSRRAVQQICSLPEVNSVFRVLVPFVGMKTAVVSYDRDDRYAGKTKYHLSSMLRYAIDSITGISIEPIYKMFFFIPILSLVPLIGAYALFLQSSEIWRVAGFIVFLLGLSICILSIILVVIGIYVGQTMIEVKRRPTSIIYEYIPADIAKERELI